MKRKLLSLLLCAALTLSLLPTAGAAFTDITDDATAMAVAGLQSLGIISGTSETTYSPGDPLTRAQVCKIITGAMGIADQAAAQARKNLFSDVLPSAWYTGYVNLAYSKNIINGYGNGTFGPNDHITYGQLATILLRMLGYTTKEIGSFWPIDYTEFCEKLELHGDLDLDPYAVLNRGQAAILVHNALKQNTASGTKPYYETISGVSSVQKVLLLDTNASDGAKEDLLMAYVISANASSVTYFERVREFPEASTGQIGALLLNRDGQAIGFVSESEDTQDVVIGTTKLTGLTDKTGNFHRIGGTAVTLVNGAAQSWSSTGYLMLGSYVGRTARIFYNENGSAAYVYLLSGSTTAGTAAVTAQSDIPASEFERKLGITGTYTITRNGMPAEAADLAKYDTAYFDGASQTLHVSDWRLSGSIEAVSPAMEYAEKITVAGCTLDVLECAWESLASCRLYDHVTLLLTDDCKVASVSSSGKYEAEMIGVLSKNGSSVTLYGSGLTLTASQITAPASLYGKLVSFTTSAGIITCQQYSLTNNERLDLTAMTLGDYKLAPNCAIYEHAGAGHNTGYVYSLSGEQGIASHDFQEISWAKSLPAASVSTYHLNAAGQVDLLLLQDVTGNCYEYGYAKKTSSSGRQQRIALRNAAGAKNLICGLSTVTAAYAGVSTHSREGSGTAVIAYTGLTAVKNVSRTDLYQKGETWYLVTGNTELPVSQSVQVHLTAADKWLSGDAGLQAAFAQDMAVTAYYDRTSNTGAKVRVIAVSAENA